MIYIDCNLTHCNLGNGNIAAIYPDIRIGMDVNDNVDVVKLRDFQTKLQQFMDKGLNSCIIGTKNNATEEL